MKISNREALMTERLNAQKEIESQQVRILICAGTGCLAGGSDRIYARLQELCKDIAHVSVEFGKEIAHVGIKRSGCHGFCEMGPLVRIEPYNILYIKVQESDCEEIFHETILQGKPIERLLYHMNGVTYTAQEEIPFYAQQTRIVLKNCGHIDAENIDEAIANGGYQALE